jgi:chromosome segregation ATPase
LIDRPSSSSSTRDGRDPPGLATSVDALHRSVAQFEQALARALPALEQRLRSLETRSPAAPPGDGSVAGSLAHVREQTRRLKETIATVQADVEQHQWETARLSGRSEEQRHAIDAAQDGQRRLEGHIAAIGARLEEITRLQKLLEDSAAQQNEESRLLHGAVVELRGDRTPLRELLDEWTRAQTHWQRLLGVSFSSMESVPSLHQQWDLAIRSAEQRWREALLAERRMHQQFTVLVAAVAVGLSLGVSYLLFGR